MGFIFMKCEMKNFVVIIVKMILIIIIKYC